MSEYKVGITASILTMKMPVAGEVVRFHFMVDGEQLIRRVIHQRTKDASRIECRRRVNEAEEYIDPIAKCDACVSGRAQEVILYALVYELSRTAKGVSTETRRPRLLAMRGRLSGQVVGLYYTVGTLISCEYALSRTRAGYELRSVSDAPTPGLTLPEDSVLAKAVDEELKR